MGMRAAILRTRIRDEAVNLNIVQGATFRLRVYLENEDGTTVNLSGSDIRCDLRTNYAYLSGEVIVSMRNGSGVTIASDGSYAELSLTAAQTAAMSPGNGVWDLEVEFPSGDTLKPLSGRWKVSPEVTL